MVPQSSRKEQGQGGSSLGCIQLCFYEISPTIYFKRRYCGLILIFLAKLFPLCTSYITLWPSRCYRLWALRYSPSSRENTSKKLPHFILTPDIVVVPFLKLQQKCSWPKSTRTPNWQALCFFKPSSYWLWYFVTLFCAFLLEKVFFLSF